MDLKAGLQRKKKSKLQVGEISQKNNFLNKTEYNWNLKIRKGLKQDSN